MTEARKKRVSKGAMLRKKDVLKRDTQRLKLVKGE